MKDHFVITIARQYGSGGREIGLRVAELLGIKSYDKELITMAAQKSGLNTNVAHHADEKATNSLLYTLAMGSGSFNTDNWESTQAYYGVATGSSVTAIMSGYKAQGN